MFVGWLAAAQRTAGVRMRSFPLLCLVFEARHDAVMNRDRDRGCLLGQPIVGARLGAAALPAKLVRQLQDQGTWRHGELAKLADRLHAARGS